MCVCARVCVFRACRRVYLVCGCVHVCVGKEGGGGGGFMHGLLQWLWVCQITAARDVIHDLLDG